MRMNSFAFTQFILVQQALFNRADENELSMYSFKIRIKLVMLEPVGSYAKASHMIKLI